MLYDNYREKILKRAAFLRKLFRFVPVMIAAFVVLLSAMLAFVLAKGTVTEVNFANHLQYGSTPSFTASAIWSEAYFEYSSLGKEQWSAETPSLPGEYDVRVATRGVFGTRYKYIDVLHIYPRRIDVTMAGSNVTYGTTPLAAASLAAGDRVVCEKFVYESNVLANTKIKADYSTVKIYNAAGEEITDAYEIDTPYADVSISPKEIFIHVADASHRYDGTEFSYKVYELAEGSLLNGDTLQARFEKTLTDVGTVKNVPVVSILNKDGVDVSHFYKINEAEIGDLIVTKRPLHIITGSAAYVYDGQSHQCLDYKINENTSLIEGHELVLKGSASLDVVGEMNNSMVFAVKDENGNDVTDNYSIIVEEGTLRVDKKPVTVTTGSATWEYDGTDHFFTEYVANGIDFGNISNIIKNYTTVTDAGTYENKFEISVFSGTSDISAFYDITYIYGTLEVTKRPITIQTASATWEYDGDPHFPTASINSNYTILAGSLAYGDMVTDNSPLIPEISITDVGNISNTSVLSIMSGEKDVTANYDITYEYGIFEVYPRPITILPKTATKVYDGTPIFATEIKFADEAMQLAKDTHILEYTINGSRTYVKDTDVSTLTDVKITDNGRDITYNYEITVLEGVLEILPREIYISSGSAEKFYDGYPLTHPDIFVTENSQYKLLERHYIVGETYGSQTNIGIGENFFNYNDVRIFCDGEDLTGNYYIYLESYGTLRVKEFLAGINVTAGSMQKAYDGTPLTYERFEVSLFYGEMLEGHTVSAVIKGTITEVGTAPNVVDLAIVLDENGNDVSYMYEIVCHDGQLRVDIPADTDTVFTKLKAEKSGLIYLKMKSYGDYNMKGFNEATAYTKLMEGKYNASYFTPIALANAGYTSYNAEFTDALIYMLPYYSAASGSYGVPTDDVNVMGTYEDSAYTVPYFVIDSYDNKLAGLQGYLGQYSDEELEYRSFVYSNYLAVESTTYDYMMNIINAQGFDINDGDIITKVASYIQNAATYNLKYNPMLDSESNVAVAFLDTYKEGKCVHYAMAATLLYRTLGIPARYVEGFMVEAMQGKVVEVMNPGHAWVEIYLDGIGWVQVEVTGSVNHTETDAVVVKPTYQYKINDGTPLIAQPEIIVTPKLAQLLDLGFTYTVEVEGTMYGVGRGVSKITSFALFDNNGNNVTDEFPITFAEGELEILPAETQMIYVYLYETRKVYDGTPVSIGDYDYEIISGGDGVTLDIDFNIDIVSAGKISLSMLNADIDRYIDYKVMKDGTDVTSLYRVQFDVFDDMDESTYTPIEITRRKIKLTSSSATKVYDGKALTSSGVDLTFGTLAEGDKLEAAATESITDVGTMENGFWYRITDSNGMFVTDNYEVECIFGTLTVLEQ